MCTSKLMQIDIKQNASKYGLARGASAKNTAERKLDIEWQISSSTINMTTGVLVFVRRNCPMSALVLMLLCEDWLTGGSVENKIHERIVKRKEKAL
jgi:hypothetical protein